MPDCRVYLITPPALPDPARFASEDLARALDAGDVGALQIRLKDVPDDAILRVRACSLNYHDVFTRRGMPGIRVPMPIIIGIDLAGEIVEVGASVRGFRVGDRGEDSAGVFDEDGAGV